MYQQIKQSHWSRILFRKVKSYGFHGIAKNKIDREFQMIKQIEQHTLLDETV